MADYRHQVDDARNQAGIRILEMTDAVGFDAYAAGWIHDRPTGTWRYLLSTPMLKTEGPLWIYQRLMTVFKHTPLPEGVSPLDIFVIDPDYELELFAGMPMGQFVSSADKPEEKTPILRISQDITFDGFSVTDGFVAFYRRLALPDRRKKRSPTRVFDRKVRMLEAA